MLSGTSFTLLFLLSLSSFRGIWIPRWSLEAGFDQILADITDAQINNCFVQVFAVGESWYPSKLTPNRAFFKSERLRQFINDCHARNIKVHAWVNMFYICSYNSLPSDSRHPMNSQPGWFVWERGGRTILSFAPDEIQNYGLEGYYLAPANWWVREYLKSVILEIVANYDFDGVHLDYVRYPSKDFAYDPATRAKFMRSVYVDPEEVFNNYSGLVTRLGTGGYDDLYQRWFRFLCDDLSSFVYELNRSIKKIRQSVALSAAVKSNPDRARDEYYQDWISWVNRGYVDFVCTMSYEKNLKPNIARIENEVFFNERVMIGLGLYNQSPEELARQLELMASYDFGGVLFFSYQEILKNRQFLNVIR